MRGCDIKLIREIFGSISLEVSDANSLTLINPWTQITSSLKSLKVNKRRKAIDGIKNIKNRYFGINHYSEFNHRMYLYELGVIAQEDVYAWFYDLWWRQNNNAVIVEYDGKKMAIDNYSGRWNRRKPWGAKVRSKIRREMEEVNSPVLLTLTLNLEITSKMMPKNTNMDEVVFTIVNIGKWISKFLHKYENFKRHNNGAEFVAWVLEFNDGNQRGVPHVHMILDGNWVGDYNKIRDMWGLGNIDVQTAETFRKKYPERKYDKIRLSNYLTKYVSKADDAVSIKGINKAYAWLAFSGGRIFNVRHKKSIDKKETKVLESKKTQ